MFHHTCSVCGRDELIFPDQWHGLDQTATGFVLAFSCWCGAEQTMTIDRDAKRAEAQSAVQAA